MSFPCRIPALARIAMLTAPLLALAGAGAWAGEGPLSQSDQATPRPVLSVCADPVNLPYTDDHLPGFESRIADLLANDMNANLKYHWERSYRGFLRRTLLAGACDVLIDVPSGLPGIAVTKPYYASSYVAVTRAKDSRHFTSFDDAWLRNANIGVQLIGTDDSATPPTSALAVRNINQHLTGYALRTSSPVPNPQGLIIDAVADGTVDVAFVWGPTAGYFAKLHEGVLRLQSISSDPQNPQLKFVFPMSMGVRMADTALRDRLQQAIDRHHAEIGAILGDYGIPTVPVPAAKTQLSANEATQTPASTTPVR